MATTSRARGTLKVSKPPLPTYFDASKLTPEESYVLWVDVMGSRTRLTRSLSMAANFVGKLHCALLTSAPAQVRLFPMNDGAFALAPDTHVIKAFVRDAFSLIYDENTRTPDIANHFMPRAGVAFGPVISGASLAGAAPVMDELPAYRDTLLLGAPIAQAFECESLTGPFGVYVHESARTMGPDPWRQGAYMRYWSSGANSPSRKGSDLLKQAEAYLAWHRDRSNEYSYPLEAIDKHARLASEFFRR